MASLAEITVAHVTSKIPAKLWGKACADAVLRHDQSLLRQLLPNVDFNVDATGRNEHTIAGVCSDGSTAIWKVGLA